MTHLPAILAKSWLCFLNGTNLRVWKYQDDEAFPIIH